MNFHPGSTQNQDKREENTSEKSCIFYRFFFSFLDKIDKIKHTN